jgi:hypothetical protein
MMIDGNFLKKITGLTNINHHTQARIEIAKELKNLELYAFFEDIEWANKEYGYLPINYLQVEREKNEKKLRLAVREKFGKCCQEAVYSCL